MAMEPLTNPVLTMSPLVASKGRDIVAGGSRANAVYSWFNQAGAAVLLVILSPVMLAIAWCIWREDGAPVFFGHWRVGQKGRLFRCLKFRSRVRRADLVLAEVLERDSTKWFRPARGQFQIYYREGADHPEYQPDFVAETPEGVYMLEPKSSGEMTDPTVLAKQEVAVKWCELATEHAKSYGGKPWRYVLIPHDTIRANMTLDRLAEQYEK